MNYNTKVTYFLKWLETQGVLANYIINTLAQKGSLETLFSNSPASWVTGAFVWRCTAEGLDHWSEIHEKWTANVESYSL